MVVKQADTRAEPETTKLSIRIPTALAKELKIACIRRGVRIQAGVEEAVRRWLKESRP